jgi:hypothetical protein
VRPRRRLRPSALPGFGDAGSVDAPPALHRFAVFPVIDGLAVWGSGAWSPTVGAISWLKKPVAPAGFASLRHGRPNLFKLGPHPSHLCSTDPATWIFTAFQDAATSLAVGFVLPTGPPPSAAWNRSTGPRPCLPFQRAAETRPRVAASTLSGDSERRVLSPERSL